MPHSLKNKIKSLCYKGELSEKERDRIIQALEQQPSEDCISRDEALKAIEKEKQGWELGETRYAIDECHTRIAELPSVTPTISKMEQVEDCIRREAVRKLICQNNDKYGYSARFHEFTDIVQRIVTMDSKWFQCTCIDWLMKHREKLMELNKAYKTSQKEFEIVMQDEVKDIEQNFIEKDVLDKIRAEIELNAYPIVYGVNNHEKGMTLYGILQVIDKYKAESEETE